MKTKLINLPGTGYEAHLENGVILEGDFATFPRFNHFKNHVIAHVLDEFMDDVEFEPTVTLKRLGRETTKDLTKAAKTAEGLHKQLIEQVLASRSDAPGQQPSFSIEEAEEAQETHRAHIDRFIDFEEVSSGLPMCGRIAGVTLDRRVPMVLYRIHVNNDPALTKHKSIKSEDIDFNDERTSAWVEQQRREALEKEEAAKAAKAAKAAEKAAKAKERAEVREAKQAAAAAEKAEAKRQREEERRVRKEAAEAEKAEKAAAREEAREARRIAKEEQAAERAKERLEAMQRKAKLAADKAAEAAKKAQEAAKKAAAAQKAKAAEANRRLKEAQAAAAKAKKATAKKAPTKRKPTAKKSTK